MSLIEDYLTAKSNIDPLESLESILVDMLKTRPVDMKRAVVEKHLKTLDEIDGNLSNFLWLILLFENIQKELQPRMYDEKEDYLKKHLPTIKGLTAAQLKALKQIKLVTENSNILMLGIKTELKGWRDTL